MQAKFLMGAYGKSRGLETLNTLVRGIDTYNSFMKEKLNATKLLEYSNINNNISTQTLNVLLASRYDVFLKLRTMYKMKNTRLHMLNGGHDKSYVFWLKYFFNDQRNLIMDQLQHVHGDKINHPERPLTFFSIFISIKMILLLVVEVSLELMRLV